MPTFIQAVQMGYFLKHAILFLVQNGPSRIGSSISVAGQPHCCSLLAITPRCWDSVFTLSFAIDFYN